MAYTPRDIDTTRGLPSFDQMVAAYKAKNALAPALEAGVQGYQAQKQFNLQQALSQTEQAKNVAEAGYYGRKEDLVPLATLTPDEQKQLGNSVQVDPITGQHGVPVSSVLAARQTALTQSESEKVAIQAEALKERTDLAQQLADTRQQLADYTATHGGAALKQAGLTTAAETGKSAKPGLVESLVGAVTSRLAPSLTSTLAPEYQAQQTGLAAQSKLAGQGGATPSYPLNSPPSPNSPATPNGIPARSYPLSPTQSVTQASPSPADQGLTNQPLAPSPTAPPNTMGNSQPNSAPPRAVGGKQPVPVYTQQDYDALPAGTPYVDSEGQKIKGQ